MTTPIVISGFGRSGTTWVSDIISKTLGGLILFEPDHPLVFSSSEEYCYINTLSDKENQTLSNHLNSVLSKSIRNTWLLRNHLPQEESASSNDFEKLVWDNSSIIGYKQIRWNHILPDLMSYKDSKVLFIIRHPLSVISSLLNRPRFFEEYGWETHWGNFKAKNPLSEIDLTKYDEEKKSIKYAVMWSITNIKALLDLTSLDLPFFQYERVYQNPFEETKKILVHLGYPNINIHPSYLFYPSMSTLKTIHFQQDSSRWNNDMSTKMFWSSTFDIAAANEHLEIIKSISQKFPSVYQLFKQMKYLTP